MLNYRLFQSIHSLAGHNHIMDSLMVFCTNKAIYLFAIFLLIIWICGGKAYKRDAFIAGLTGVIALLANVVISHIYYEPRPFVTHHVHTLIPHAADASFPSDHATGSFAIAFFMIIRHKRIGGVMLLLAILTGFSRIYCGIHYPFDVLGSIVVALIIASIISKSRNLWNPIADFFINIYQSIVNKFKRNSTGKTMDS